MARTKASTWIAPGTKLVHSAVVKFGTAGPRYAVALIVCEEQTRTVFQWDLNKSRPVTCLECLAKGAK